MWCWGDESAGDAGDVQERVERHRQLGLDVPETLLVPHPSSESRGPVGYGCCNGNRMASQCCHGRTAWRLRLPGVLYGGQVRAVLCQCKRSLRSAPGGLATYF